MSYLQNIGAFSGDNLGSLLDLKVVRRDDIDIFPDPVDGVIYEDIELKAGISWITWAVTKSTPRHQASNRGSMEGDFESAFLNFVIPKDQAGIRRMLQLTQQDELVVLYKDANNQQKVFGSVDDPVRFRFSHDSGGATSQRNAYSCEFYSEGAANSWFYDGTLGSPPSGSAPALVRVNGVLVASLTPGQSIDFDTDFDFDFQIVGT